MRNKIFVTKMTAGIEIAVLLMGSMFMAGCKTSEKKNAAADTSWCYTWDGDSISETGLFYFDEPYLRFFDGESGADVIVCDKASCAHDDVDCSAYFSGSIRIPIPVESGLQLVTDLDADVLGEISLYECSVNGENRKKITDFSTSMQFINDAIWTDDWIILAYHNKYDADYNDLEQTQTGIYVYDRKAQTGKVVWSNEDYQADTAQLELSGSQICFRYSYCLYDNDTYNRMLDAGDTESLIDGICVEEYVIDLESGESTLVTDDKPSALTWSEKTDGVYVILDETRLEYWPKLTGTKEEDRETILEGDLIQLLDSCVDGMKYFSVYHSSTGRTEAYAYDEGSKELKNLGDVTDYGIRVIFENKVYLWDYGNESGYGVRAAMPYEDFLQGDFTELIRSDHSEAEE